jgi:hypothetical protein
MRSWSQPTESTCRLERSSKSSPYEFDLDVRKQRARILARALRKLCYDVAITPINPAMA